MRPTPLALRPVKERWMRPLPQRRAGRSSDRVGRSSGRQRRSRARLRSIGAPAEPKVAKVLPGVPRWNVATKDPVYETCERNAPTVKASKVLSRTVRRRLPCTCRATHSFLDHQREQCSRRRHNPDDQVNRFLTNVILLGLAFKYDSDCTPDDEWQCGKC